LPTVTLRHFRHNFCEERFVVLISSNRNLSATDLMNILVESVKNFSKEAPQHDDMTVVIIKIL